MTGESLKSKPQQTPQSPGLFGWITWDRKASEGDVDVILSRSEGDVLHAAAAIFVVLTGHLGLRRTLDGQAETSGASTSEGQTSNKIQNCLIASEGDSGMLSEQQ